MLIKPHISARLVLTSPLVTQSTLSPLFLLPSFSPPSLPTSLSSTLALSLCILTLVSISLSLRDCGPVVWSTRPPIPQAPQLSEGQGAITEKLRSFSMHDLTQIPHNDAVGQLYPGYSNPATARRAQNADTVDGAEYYEYEQDDRTDEETEPTFSEDEAVTQRGLRRSQSVKITRSKGRKDVRYGSLKIKGKKRPLLSSVNYGT